MITPMATQMRQLTQALLFKLRPMLSKGRLWS
jgi:hypothetical protein